MTKRSKGEEAFAASFEFLPFVPEADHELLRDFFYKYAHNYDEAKEYLQILKQVYEIDSDSKSELLFRINGMALQSFGLAMRRMTDNASKRGVQWFLKKVVKKEYLTAESTKVSAIYGHYERYLNKGVAHQDIETVHDNLAAFPDTDIIDADMKQLADLYDKLAKEICYKYIGIHGEPFDYSTDLKKLAKD